LKNGLKEFFKEEIKSLKEINDEFENIEDFKK